MDSNVSYVMQIANVSAAVAQNYLAASGGDVNGAISLIMDESTEALPQNPVQPPSISNNKPAPRPQQKPAIKGFSDIRSVDPDDEKRDSYFAGGEKSGIAILDPNKHRDDVIDKVFESAMKHGAVSKCDLPPEEKEKFTGVGYTLGNTTENSQKVQSKPQQQALKTVLLTFWKDCFTVDDGPPRHFSDPANKGFIDDVNRGVVPRELEAMAGGRDVNIELVNKKNEPYAPPPKPKMLAFSGTGQTLGGESTTTTSTSSGTKVATAKLITVDESQPTTTIQIRLHDGGRLVIKCNHTNTVGDIRGHIEASKPTGKPMELRTTFPTKLLDNDALTVKEAGLLNAAIAQKV